MVCSYLKKLQKIIITGFEIVYLINKIIQNKNFLNRKKFGRKSDCLSYQNLPNEWKLPRKLT